MLGAWGAALAAPTTTPPAAIARETAARVAPRSSRRQRAPISCAPGAEKASVCLSDGRAFGLQGPLLRGQPPLERRTPRARAGLQPGRRLLALASPGPGWIRGFAERAGTQR